ncbi:MAG: hypothetical protein ACLFTK_09550 [Anaerolineales bacterium]
MSLFIIPAQDSPGYTDAYYYYNAAASLARGAGLTDEYLWMYINAPEALPAESHRYWMPLTSIWAAGPLVVFGTSYSVAQMAFVPLLIGLSWVGFWLGYRMENKRRHAWVAGLSIIFGGFYLPFWLATDSFVLFGLVGAGSLIALGLANGPQAIRWYALAGVLSALAHLTRADGLLLLLVGLWMIGLRAVANRAWREGLMQGSVLLAAYLLVMLPWFMRNMAVIGAPLPAGGINTAFLLGYDDLFSYPADYPVSAFVDWGLGNIIQSRLEGALVAFQTWLAVEGLILLGPFALLALWIRRAEPFWRPMMWYALGLHLVMAFVFTYPGMRGGLFHSSAALYPFWIALGLAGLDAAIAWLGKRRGWRQSEAQLVFGIAVVFLPVILGVFAWNGQQSNQRLSSAYATISADLPAEARLMVNDPAAWYYHTGYAGVTLPDESLATALAIAERYCITHLVIDRNVTPAFRPLIRDDAEPPPFLAPMMHLDGDTPDDWRDDTRVYRFAVDCTPR